MEDKTKPSSTKPTGMGTVGPAELLLLRDATLVGVGAACVGEVVDEEEVTAAFDGAVAGSAGEGCGPLQHTQLQHPPV